MTRICFITLLLFTGPAATIAPPEPESNFPTRRPNETPGDRGRKTFPIDNAPAVTARLSCRTLEKRVKDRLQKSRRCRRADDCTSFWRRCRLYYVNRSLPVFERFKADAAEYRRRCKGEPPCMPARPCPGAGPTPVCEEGLCGYTCEPPPRMSRT